ncbi:hypothetical protein F2P81_007923 [Scophthalmus maximus]|uniref:Uncharacterized protein n=1 Tax=Scophthalmus maximus TaxID=52904 RepID=A0A6A4T5X5_SCOMX|nr:hypothetical protein F2P81_007923 [Scophthalmus maximus]
MMRDTDQMGKDGDFLSDVIDSFTRFNSCNELRRVCVSCAQIRPVTGVDGHKPVAYDLVQLICEMDSVAFVMFSSSTGFFGTFGPV